MSSRPFPLIVAHRGFSAAHRENSPSAWLAAIDAEADLVETDIRFTRDGVAVCSHDADLQRIAGRADAICNLDAEALSGITADGSPAAPRLDAFFEIMPRHAAILFDVKDERPEALDRLLAAIEASGRDGIHLGLHAVAGVRHVRQRSVRPIVGLLTDPSEETAFFAAGGDILRLWENRAEPARLASLAREGLPVWVTTGHHGTDRRVGDFEAGSLIRMAASGAGGFLVNDPVAAQRTIAAGVAMAWS